MIYRFLAALIALALAGCAEIYTKAVDGTVSVVSTVPTLMQPDAKDLGDDARAALV